MRIIKYAPAILLYKDTFPSNPARDGGASALRPLLHFTQKHWGGAQLPEIYLWYLRNDAVTLEKGLKGLQSCKSCITTKNTQHPSWHPLATKKLHRGCHKLHRGHGWIVQIRHRAWLGTDRRGCGPACTGGVNPILSKWYLSQRCIV